MIEYNRSIGADLASGPDFTVRSEWERGLDGAVKLLGRPVITTVCNSEVHVRHVARQPWRIVGRRRTRALWSRRGRR